MIAMTARTGSSHLCSGLSSVLPIGKPTELFNARDTLVWEKKKRGAKDFAELLQAYYAESDDTIVFKTSWVDFDFFQDKIFDMFPNLNFIYLNRLDIEAQAVSLFKALVTKKWHEASSIAFTRDEPFDVVLQKFDLVRICSLIKMLEQEKRSWEKFFFTQGLTPPRIHYEDFTSDLSTAVKFVAMNIGYKEICASDVESEFSVLSDKVNEQWLRDVRDYRSGLFYQRLQESTDFPGRTSPPSEPLAPKSIEA
jgi:LPS sulfotransferase NodH